MASNLIPYTAMPMELEEERFAAPLNPVVQAAFLFGADAIYDTIKANVSKIYFIVMFTFMLAVACVAVFLRSTIDMWIQFSLYIVPVITIVCGRRYFNSVAFRELLYRLVQSRAMLSSSIPDKKFTNSSYFSETRSSLFHKRSWLRGMAMKCCLYPLLIELIQWSAYFIFQYFTQHDKSNFAGNKEVTRAISSTCWIILYSIFWSLGVYQVGMFTFQFILVTNIIRRDALSLMELHGDSPFLWIPKSHLDEGYVNTPSCFKRFLKTIIDLILMDTFNDSIDMTNFLGHYQHSSSLQRNGKKGHHLVSKFPARCLEQETPTPDGNERGLSPKERNEITPEEASVILAHFVTDIQAITSFFTPFTTALLFFSFTNLITHLCIFALGDIEMRHWWTFVRTIIWLLLTIRVIISVAKVTRTLSQIAPHVKYLRAAGLLEGDDGKWERFFMLTEHFRLNERSFGFPLTLKQVGIMTAFLKMTFLIILSIMKAKPGVDLL
eukprot:gene12283-13548_t